MWKYTGVCTQFVADMYSESMWETGGVYYYTRN